MRDLQETRRVPAKIGYNATRRLEVKMPVGGVVTRVLVQLGQHVKSGDTLAILTSVDVGLARDEVVQSEAEAEIARKERDWNQQIAVNLDALLEMLKSHPSPEEIDVAFRDKLLGSHRDRILSAYSKYLLSDRTSEVSESLASRGALSDLTIRERRSGKEVAHANYESAREQSRFEAMQQRAKTQAAFDHAERLVNVSRQKLKLQLGPFAEIADTSADSALCEVRLHAAIDGLVEERRVTDASQFQPAQNLFVIANTDTLWVSAQLYEREWALLGKNTLSELSVETPAAPGEALTAKVLYVSVEMSADTRAVPLVAEINNTDGRLKPGMFAWVTVPVGSARSVLAVPETAITRHEQKAFVFVEQAPGEFRKVDVLLGMTSPEFVEITHGITAGQSVVDQGVFQLKSELLLQVETD